MYEIDAGLVTRIFKANRRTIGHGWYNHLRRGLQRNHPRYTAKGKKKAMQHLNCLPATSAAQHLSDRLALSCATIPLALGSPARAPAQRGNPRKCAAHRAESRTNRVLAEALCPFHPTMRTEWPCLLAPLQKMTRLPQPVRFPSRQHCRLGLAS